MANRLQEEDNAEEWALLPGQDWGGAARNAPQERVTPRRYLAVAVSNHLCPTMNAASEAKGIALLAVSVQYFGMRQARAGMRQIGFNRLVHRSGARSPIQSLSLRCGVLAQAPKYPCQTTARRLP